MRLHGRGRLPHVRAASTPTPPLSSLSLKPARGSASPQSSSHPVAPFAAPQHPPWPRHHRAPPWPLPPPPPRARARHARMVLSSCPASAALPCSFSGPAAPPQRRSHYCCVISRRLAALPIVRSWLPPPCPCTPPHVHTPPLSSHPRLDAPCRRPPGPCHSS